MAFYGAIVVNDDAIVTMLHGGDYTLYNKQLKPLYKSIEDHIIHLGVISGKDVIVDRGLNISIDGRRRFIALAKSLDVKIRAVVFTRESPEIHAKRRFDHDNRGRPYEYWLEAAKHHDAVYQYPTKEEGFDEIVLTYYAGK